MLDVGARIFLLEWLPPTPSERNFGLGDCALRLPEAAAREIARKTGEECISLGGHSIGGTFAAIFTTLRPELVRRLGLIERRSLLERWAVPSPLWHARPMRRT